MGITAYRLYVPNELGIGISRREFALSPTSTVAPRRFLPLLSTVLTLFLLVLLLLPLFGAFDPASVSRAAARDRERLTALEQKVAVDHETVVAFKEFHALERIARIEGIVDLELKLMLAVISFVLSAMLAGARAAFRFVRRVNKSVCAIEGLQEAVEELKGRTEELQVVVGTCQEALFALPCRPGELPSGCPREPKIQL